MTQGEPEPSRPGLLIMRWSNTTMGQRCLHPRFLGSWELSGTGDMLAVS